MPDEENELKRATLHVAAAEHIVAQQRERIAKLKADDHEITNHEQMLDLFMRTLEAFKDHERLLMSEVAEKQTRSK